MLYIYTYTYVFIYNYIYVYVYIQCIYIYIFDVNQWADWWWWWWWWWWFTVNHLAMVHDGPPNDQTWDHFGFPRIISTIPDMKFRFSARDPGSIPLQPPQQHLDADASRDRAKQGAREEFWRTFGIKKQIVIQLGIQPSWNEGSQIRSNNFNIWDPDSGVYRCNLELGE